MANAKPGKKFNIVLIGYRAVGKTTVGEQVAQMLGRTLIDFDAILEQEAGEPIADLVSREGWPEFRRREKEVVQRYAIPKGMVLATGGGVVLDRENTALLKATGKLIWLRALPATIKARLSRDIKQTEARPGLTAKGTLDEIDEVLADREPLYQERGHGKPLRGCGIGGRGGQAHRCSGTGLGAGKPMSGNTYGKVFRLTTWGESHGPALGAVIDGCPPRLPLTAADIDLELARRRPGTSIHTTQRRESDKVEILSGVFQGQTTGTPISLIIFNQDVKSESVRAPQRDFSARSRRFHLSGKIRYPGSPGRRSGFGPRNGRPGGGGRRGPKNPGYRRHKGYLLYPGVGGQSGPSSLSGRI